MLDWFIIVSEDNDQVEVLNLTLNSLDGYQLNLIQKYQEKGPLYQRDQRVGCRGNKDAVLVRRAKEALVFEGNIKLEMAAPFGLDLLDELEEDLVQEPPLLLLSLLLLELVLEPGLSGPGVAQILVAGADLSNELNVLCQLFLDHDRLVEIEVQENDLIVVAGLENSKFHIAVHEGQGLLVFINESKSVFEGSQSPIRPPPLQSWSYLDLMELGNSFLQRSVACHLQLFLLYRALEPISLLQLLYLLQGLNKLVLILAFEAELLQVNGAVLQLRLGGENDVAAHSQRMVEIDPQNQL